MDSIRIPLEKTKKITGDAIRKARKEAGMTQSELAEKLHTSKSLISQYENGARYPKPATLERFAVALGVPVYQLMGYSSPSQVSKGMESMIKSIEDLKASVESMTQEYFAIMIHENEGAEIISKYFSLNEEGKKEAAKRISELAILPQYMTDNNLKEYQEYWKDGQINAYIREKE